ncbi:unnamed protein product [Sphagnum troendelagicum]|uniref:Aminotransferase class I/classII large domain-containing protein n=1 Tax=Sphagnum troendelagicum TaxID=128251 RepID=A0ABP0TC13_9BRYO
MEYKVMGPDSLNPNVKNTVNTLTGELFLRAFELQKEGKKIIFAHAGNPHALGQKPLTFPRQVMALCQAPFLMDNPHVGLLFPSDAIARAKEYLAMNPGGVGASSVAKGILGVRQEIADFILERDGYPSDPETIFLTDGTSSGVQKVLNLLIRNEKDGIMVPIPKYPLYSAAISLFGGTLVPYYLSEEANWQLDFTDLQKSILAARREGITVQGLVLINPGNPTSQCLTEADLKGLIELCIKETLVLLVDEVYQQNIYQDDHPFISARKVLMDMGQPTSSTLELISFHSASKGFLGECGQRGGYFELTNIHPKTVDELYKVASISVGNVSGQILMGLMVKPPRPGTVSYPRYAAESQSILDSLRLKAHIMTDGFNESENVICNFTEGALFCFPQVKLPEAAIAAAQEAGKAPDLFYCLKLLEATGLLTVPGSGGYDQKEGTFHIRATILPAEEDMPRIMDSFKKFNNDFMCQFRDSDNILPRL